MAKDPFLDAIEDDAALAAVDDDDPALAAVDGDPALSAIDDAKPSLFKRIKAAAKSVLIGEKGAPHASYPGKLPVDPMGARIEEARGKDVPLVKMTAREKPKPATREEAAAAVDRLKLDDEALAALLNPDAPDAVTGDDLRVKRVADYELANKFISNRKVLEGLKPNLTPKPLPTTAATDASTVAPAAIQPAQAIPAVTLEPKPLEPAAPADAAATPTPAPDADPALKEAKLVERAQTLAEALPSFGKGAVKGVTAGLVDPTGGTEGAPGALGQIAGNLAGGVAAGLTGPVGAPAFLMTQFLTDLEERGMDPAKMADPEILALAATSGLFGGLTPVAFGKKALTRALTGGALGAAQNVAEEDIIAQVTETEPERLKALILGGAFGAGFGAAFRESPAVREAVEAKLPEADVKVLDEVVADSPPIEPDPTTITVAPDGTATPRGESPRAEEPAAPTPEPVAATLTPEAEAILTKVDEGAVPAFMTRALKGAAEDNGIVVKDTDTPNDVIEALRAKRDAVVDEPVAVAPEVLPDGAAVPAAAAAEAINVPTLNAEAPKVEILTPEAPRADASAPVVEAAAPKPKGTPPDASPTKPFGSTPEGVVRAPDPDERYTSARKGWTTKQRERMDLNTLPSPQREEWRAVLNEAKEKNLDAEAESLAHAIIEKPRALTDVETAGMVIRMESLVQQHEAALDNLAKTTDPVTIAEQSRALRDIEDQFDTVSKAVRYSGTEKGRNLAAQKLTINKSYDLVHILSRAKAAKGKDITPEERAKFEKLSKEYKGLETKLLDAENRIRDLRARDAIKERSRSPRRSKPEVKAQIADLTEKTRRLLRAGCLTS